MQSIDMILNGIEWIPTGGTDDGSGMPYATHTGSFHIGKDRIDNLEFISCRQVATNVLADLFSIGIHPA